MRVQVDCARRILFAAAGALAIGAAVPALANVKDGVDAWSRGDYVAAVAEWKGPASKGDADAQFNLAQAYRLGHGVEPDMAKARELYERAAVQGHIKAADNYGLMLFQEGQRQRAMPYIEAAAGRGDPRAQYVLGLSHFNGELAEKNWVRAYALVSLAQASGLPQATGALQQMDSYIALEDRQRAQLLAADIKRQSDAQRAAQFASADLGDGPAAQVTASAPTRVPRPVAQLPVPPSSAAASIPASNPATAGADYARPKGAVLVAGSIAPRPAPATVASTPAPAVTAPARPAPAEIAASGPWRIQLGAFGVKGNAERLWNKLSSRAELAGKRQILSPAGRLTKLQAGGWAKRADAQAVCTRLKSQGQACIVVGG